MAIDITCSCVSLIAPLVIASQCIKTTDTVYARLDLVSCGHQMYVFQCPKLISTHYGCYTLKNRVAFQHMYHFMVLENTYLVSQVDF